jgi:mRNA-degrading endonuclease toxin of MazEF toxin-antitoxin module
VFGEIFICQFPFTSGLASKPRPVLCLFDLGQDVIICRITSVQRTGKLDIPLNDWQQAGPAKPFVARLDRILAAEKNVLDRRLGYLSAGDKETVKQAWNQHMRL